MPPFLLLFCAPKSERTQKRGREGKSPISANTAAFPGVWQHYLVNVGRGRRMDPSLSPIFRGLPKHGGGKSRMGHIRLQETESPYDCTYLLRSLFFFSRVFCAGIFRETGDKKGKGLIARGEIKWGKTLGGRRSPKIL